MPGPEETRQMFRRSAGVGRAWLLPHIALLVACVALPVLYPGTWKWWTPAGGGLFFGLAILADVLVMRAVARLEAEGMMSPRSEETYRPEEYAALAPSRRGSCPRCGHRLRVQMRLVLPTISLVGFRLNCPECSLLLRPRKKTVAAVWVSFFALLALGFGLLSRLPNVSGDEIWPFVIVTAGIVGCQALIVRAIQDFEPAAASSDSRRAT